MVNSFRIKGEFSIKMGTKIIVSSVVNSLKIKGEFSVLENSLPSVPSLFYIGKVKHKKVLFNLPSQHFLPDSQICALARKKVEMNVEGGK